MPVGRVGCELLASKAKDCRSQWKPDRLGDFVLTGDGEMVRLLAMTLFLATLIVASDCQGQLIGNGWIRSRQMRAVTPDNALRPVPAAAYSFDQDSEYSVDQDSEYSEAVPSMSLSPNGVGHAYQFPTQAYFSSGQSRFSRVFDGPLTHKYRDPAEVDSRYTGGFHQSHFDNIGLPSGDIGLRGNALNWRTW